MKHTITINATQFTQALKDATLYVSKKRWDDPMNYIVLSLTDQNRKLAVIACDGLGYYERQLVLSNSEEAPEPSLPGKKQELCIALTDALKISKHITPRSDGNISISLNDTKKSNGNYLITLTLPDRSTTTLFSNAGVNVPDYSVFVSKAEASKENAPDLFDVSVPVHEMVRAGKVLPRKSGAVARMYTSVGHNKGHMALLEYTADDEFIRIIFMFAQNVAKAA